VYQKRHEAAVAIADEGKSISRFLQRDIRLWWCRELGRTRRKERSGTSQQDELQGIPETHRLSAANVNHLYGSASNSDLMRIGGEMFFTSAVCGAIVSRIVRENSAPLPLSGWQ